jgi:hypothetical protein
MPTLLRRRRSLRRHFQKPRLEPLESRVVLSVPSTAPTTLTAASPLARPILEIVPLSPSTAVGPFGAPTGVLPLSGSAKPGGILPSQMREAYGINNITFGSVVGDGTGQTIAIVDAYDDPSFVNSTNPNFSTSDLAEFDSSFGLPNPPSFTKVNQTGGSTLPGTDPSGPGHINWEAEEALDVEWAHVIAPGASIVLVECQSNSWNDLLQGVSTAAGLAGVSVVSMSWGSGEFSGETSDDSSFTTPSGHQGVTFLAATGDSGSPGEYPAYSPNVVAVGGTYLKLNTDGSYFSETAWSGSGGGTSAYETEPSYQDGVQSTGHRTIPDVSFDASPSSGVPVYDSYNNGTAKPWWKVGGTSLATPCWAGLVAIINQGRTLNGLGTLNSSTNPTQTQTALYSIPSSDFHDITSGSNGGFSAGPGYDEVTGLGTPQAGLSTPDMVTYGAGPVTATQLVVVVQPRPDAVAGTAFNLSVMAENATGEVDTNFSGSITLSLASNPGGDTLGGTLTLTASQGRTTFSNLTLTKAADGYTIQATTNGLSSATTLPFNLVAANAAKLVVTTQPPASVTAGKGFTVVVTAYDPYGNVATSFKGSETIALKNNPGGATLGGTLTQKAKSGVATFGGLSITTAANGYTLQVTSTGLKSATTLPFNVVATAAAKLVVMSQPPSSVLANSPFGFAVTVEDKYGNVVNNYMKAVMVTIGNNPGDSTLGGTLSVLPSQGVATFTNLTLNNPGNGYTLVATSGTLASVTTDPFNVTSSATPTSLVAMIATTSSAAPSGRPPGAALAGAGRSWTSRPNQALLIDDLPAQSAEPVLTALGRKPARPWSVL